MSIHPARGIRPLVSLKIEYDQFHLCAAVLGRCFWMVFLDDEVLFNHK